MTDREKAEGLVAWFMGNYEMKDGDLEAEIERALVEARADEREAFARLCEERLCEIQKQGFFANHDTFEVSQLLRQVRERGVK